jgi:hypothetical protein
MLYRSTRWSKSSRGLQSDVVLTMWLLRCIFTSTHLKHNSAFVIGPEAEGISFTRFHVTLAFSIDFVVSTQVSNEGSSKAGDASKIHVSGMPRLSFNLTSSAIRLVARLQERWRSRKRETENVTIYTAEDRHRWKVKRSRFSYGDGHYFEAQD